MPFRVYNRESKIFHTQGKCVTVVWVKSLTGRKEGSQTGRKDHGQGGRITGREDWIFYIYSIIRFDCFVISVAKEILTASVTHIG